MNYPQKASFSKQHQNPNLGKIYTINRQPLSQISFPSQSLLADHQHPEHSSPKKQYPKQKIIKFVGDTQSNIDQIITSMDTLIPFSGKTLKNPQIHQIQQQITQILQIFYSKIHKIRRERQFYKQSYEIQKKDHENTKILHQKEFINIKQKIYCLEKENQSLLEKLQNQTKKKAYFEREFQILKQKNNLIQNEIHEQSRIFNNEDLTMQIYQDFQQKMPKQNNDETLNQTRNSKIVSLNQHQLNQQSQVESNLMDSQDEMIYKIKDKPVVCCEQKQQIEMILKKHNLQPRQLKEIVEEYLREIRNNYEKDFENEHQRNLYLLAKKMEAKVWNKKVQKDIQKIIQAKQSTKN